MNQSLSRIDYLLLADYVSTQKKRLTLALKSKKKRRKQFYVLLFLLLIRILKCLLKNGKKIF